MYFENSKKRRKKNPIIGTPEVLENIENKSLCYESVPSFKVKFLTLKAFFLFDKYIQDEKKS